MERGHGLTRDLAHTRPTDILIAGWDRSKPAALYLTITSPLCSAILSKSCHEAGAAALAAEAYKLHANGQACFLCVESWSDDTAVTHASLRVIGFSGDATVRSKAAGFSRSQFGSRTSVHC